MSITQNSKIRRITDSTLVIGADIAKKVHVARASDVRGVELGKPLTFDNSRHGFEKLLFAGGNFMVAKPTRSMGWHDCS
jgi:transposase